MSEESRIYLKCTFDCYVSLTETDMKKRFDADILLLSQVVGGHFAISLEGLEQISKSELTLKAGDITTKYISARQGVKHFKKED